MTKDLFIESIEALEKQYRHDAECSEYASKIFNGDFISCYDNHWVTNQLTKVLQIESGDPLDKHSWIDYFCWELDFGKQYKPGTVKASDGTEIPLATAEDLWNLIQGEQ